MQHKYSYTEENKFTVNMDARLESYIVNCLSTYTKCFLIYSEFLIYSYILEILKCSCRRMCAPIRVYACAGTRTYAYAGVHGSADECARAGTCARGDPCARASVCARKGVYALVGALADAFAHTGPCALVGARANVYDRA